MVAILSFLIVICFALLVMRFAAMALMFTGLSAETARFQARSAYTGVGFTTAEAESVVNHPVRRRIIMIVMLLGNIGATTAAGTFIISMVSTASADRWWWNVMLLSTGLGLVLALSRSRLVERRLNRLIAAALRRWTRLDVRDYVAVLQLQNGYAVSELKLDEPDWLTGKSLQEAELSHEGILVLGIGRSDGHYEGAPQASTRFHAGDNVVLYGPINRVDELDQRLEGDAGDAAHHAAVEHHQRMQAPHRDTAVVTVKPDV